MAEEEALTPMMIQYRGIKEKYKTEVVFFRLGDFYEMFDEDAVEVSRLLNLTLTHRASRPMCGIPSSWKKNSYLRAGWRNTKRWKRNCRTQGSRNHYTRNCC